MLLQLKADLDKLKNKLDIDNANFEIEQAEHKTIREDFIAGLSKFFKPSHDSSPSLLSTPLQDGDHEDGEQTVDVVGLPFGPPTVVVPGSRQ